MEEIKLTGEQQLYLQHILDYWRKNSQWPTHQYLDRIFYEEYPDLDIEEIWKSLPQDLTGYMDLNRPDSKATLTVPAIYLLERDAPELTNFLTLLKDVLIGIYVPDEDQFSSEKLIQYWPTWRIYGIYKLGWLLLVEPGIWQSFGGPDENGNWTCKLARSIRRFREVTIIEEYLEKRNIYPKIASLPSIPETPIINTSVTVECTLHPDIYEKCWRLYKQGHYENAIFNATKALEVAVREKSGLSDKLGADLMAQAFRAKNPVLKYSDKEAEQDGVMSLMRGMIQVYKNPQSHRFVGIEDKSECLGIMLICSSLLYTIDNTSVTVAQPA